MGGFDSGTVCAKVPLVIIWVVLSEVFLGVAARADGFFTLLALHLTTVISFSMGNKVMETYLIICCQIESVGESRHSVAMGFPEIATTARR